MLERLRGVTREVATERPGYSIGFSAGGISIGWRVAGVFGCAVIDCKSSNEHFFGIFTWSPPTFPLSPRKSVSESIAPALKGIDMLANVATTELLVFSNR